MLICVALDTMLICVALDIMLICVALDIMLICVALDIMLICVALDIMLICVALDKFCSLRPKWCVIAGSSDTHSVCVCTHHQNAVLLVDAISWEITYKDLISKVACDLENRICMMHRCEQCPGSNALMEVLYKELEDFEPDAEFLYSQWQTTDRSMLVT